MKKLVRIASVGILFAFTAIAFCQDVHTDYDKHAMFGNYHTYSWGKVQTTDPCGNRGFERRLTGHCRPRAGKKWSREAM